MPSTRQGSADLHPGFPRAATAASFLVLLHHTGLGAHFPQPHPVRRKAALVTCGDGPRLRDQPPPASHTRASPSLRAEQQAYTCSLHESLFPWTRRKLRHEEMSLSTQAVLISIPQTGRSLQCLPGIKVALPGENERGLATLVGGGMERSGTPISVQAEGTILFPPGKVLVQTLGPVDKAS